MSEEAITASEGSITITVGLLGAILTRNDYLIGGMPAITNCRFEEIERRILNIEKHLRNGSTVFQTPDEKARSDASYYRRLGEQP